VGVCCPEVTQPRGDWGLSAPIADKGGIVGRTRLERLLGGTGSLSLWELSPEGGFDRDVGAGLADWNSGCCSGLQALYHFWIRLNWDLFKPSDNLRIYFISKNEIKIIDVTTKISRNYQF
jgi:hypothetical protein